VDRFDWLHHIQTLDPDRDHFRIYQIMVAHEFPWDITQALGLALYRTYAVPSIGGLLASTGEFTERVQKRYDDTGLILDAILEHGPDSAPGRTAIRRMNQMHGAYGIPNDDLRYVLSTFVVVPIEWLRVFGWRPPSGHEILASTNYYQQVGRYMGIRGIPETYEEFETLLRDYEREHFGFDPGACRVADATLDLMTTFRPFSLLPKKTVYAATKALMDSALLDAFGYRHPSRPLRTLVHRIMRLRARIERRMPPREEPRFTRNQPQIRSYPDGYEVARLGTFPGKCPIPAGGAQEVAPGSAHTVDWHRLR
jgi:hypothetical protein